MSTKPTETFLPLILELCDRRPSAYEMEGNSEETLDTSCSQLILTESVRVDENGKRIPIRYIAGKDIIDIAEQDKLNMKPNSQMDIICFDYGHLVVERKGMNVGLYDYLKNCEFNASNDRRPEGADVSFKEINPIADSEERMDFLEPTAEAMTYLATLRKNDGQKGFVYDVERIAYLSKLFNTVPSGDTDQQRLQALIEFAMARPDYFMKVIGETSNDIKVLIATAIELGVISMDGKNASFTEDQKIICKISAKDVNKRVEEVVAYLDSENGNEDYTILRARVESAKLAEIEKKDE